MKKKIFHLFVISVLLGMSTMSCNQNLQNASTTEQNEAIVLQDYGAEPTVLDIDAYSLFNDNFRVALWTGTQLQVTLMSIPVGGDIGLELHPDVDQFLRIEDGEGKVMMGDSEESLPFIKNVERDFAVFVPAGKWHNIVNTGNKPLKLYSIYSPVEHPFGTVHKTQEDEE